MVTQRVGASHQDLNWPNVNPCCRQNPTYYKAILPVPFSFVLSDVQFGNKYSAKYTRYAYQSLTFA